MGDQPLAPANVFGLTSGEMDELDRLRHLLGHRAFNQIQQWVWNPHLAEHKPQPTPPHYPRIWRELLETLRVAARH